MITYLERVVGLRDFLRARRSRFRTQADMADYIERRTGWRPSQAVLSQWLSGARYPDRSSRFKLQQAFGISESQFWKMQAFDAREASDSHRDPGSLDARSA